MPTTGSLLRTPLPTGVSVDPGMRSDSGRRGEPVERLREGLTWEVRRAVASRPTGCAAFAGDFDLRLFLSVVIRLAMRDRLAPFFRSLNGETIHHLHSFSSKAAGARHTWQAQRIFDRPMRAQANNDHYCQQYTDQTVRHHSLLLFNFHRSDLGQSLIS